jgi:hypothetical protein
MKQCLLHINRRLANHFIPLIGRHAVKPRRLAWTSVAMVPANNLLSGVTDHCFLQGSSVVVVLGRSIDPFYSFYVSTHDTARVGGARLMGRCGGPPPGPPSRELPARDNCPTVLENVKVPFLARVVPSGISNSTIQLRVCLTPRSEGGSRDRGLSVSSPSPISSNSLPPPAVSPRRDSIARLISVNDMMISVVSLFPTTKGVRHCLYLFVCAIGFLL